jgi:hypothetical protein
MGQSKLGALWKFADAVEIDLRCGFRVWFGKGRPLFGYAFWTGWPSGKSVRLGTIAPLDSGFRGIFASLVSDPWVVFILQTLVVLVHCVVIFLWKPGFFGGVFCCLCHLARSSLGLSVLLVCPDC